MNEKNASIPYDSHAIRVLEFDAIRTIVAGHAESVAGRETLVSADPAADAGVARALLAEAKECMQALRYDDSPPSTGLKDTRELFPYLRIRGRSLGIEGIRAIGDNLRIARLVSEYWNSRGDRYPLIHEIVLPVTPHEELEREIDRVITPDLTIADTASPELRNIRRKLERARGSLRDIVDRTLAGLGDDVVADRLVTIRNGRHVIPVRDSMTRQVPGAIQDRSQTGKTIFIEPMASIEANNRVIELESAEQAEIERILAALTARLADITEDIETSSAIITRLDVITARARYGVRVEGVAPEISEHGILVIRRGRHPLLDWKRRNAAGGPVVPLDLEFGGDTVTIVITGPNAGGKTVALKTIGLLTLMAMAGIPAPAADGTTLPAPAGVFADIGDEQSIENDLSTFSSHMRQIVTILQEARAGSLVLLDELGSGTNPADGESIALAVLRSLTGRSALTVATTHHGGLKVFAHETPGVMNASMQFDSERIAPTFALRTGIPGSSYAFEIAGRMGMPEDVLRDAESLAGGERKSLEGLIAEMEEHLRIADDERRDAESERKRLERSRAELETKLAKIRETRDELMREAVEESRGIVTGANSRIETAIREIREQAASREAIAAAREEAERAAAEIEEHAASVPAKPEKQSRAPVETLEPGMHAWSASLNGEVVVEEVFDGGARARIRAGKGPVAMVVGKSDLYRSASQPKHGGQQISVSISTKHPESYEIDLRGMTFDEAKTELDIFLDRLHMAGFETAHIIHGKGTGALRKKIGRYLDKHPRVESHRLGAWNEGSYGVTVVTLRN